MVNKERKDNCLYSKTYGYPYLSVDYIEIEQNVEYQIKIKCERKDYEYNFFPEVEVPKYLGYIKTRENATDMYGKNNKVIPILVCMVDMNNQETVINFVSELGGIKITFCCQFQDREMGQKVIVTQHGDTGHRIKMLKEEIASNKVRYFCRAPYETEKDNLIFTVEWEKVEHQ